VSGAEGTFNVTYLITFVGGTGVMTGTSDDPDSIPLTGHAVIGLVSLKAEGPVPASNVCATQFTATGFATVLE
jgi:hypothetical protein